MREEWDVYGEDCLPIKGRVSIRGNHDLGANEYHLVVYAWIFLDGNRVLISQRQKGKSFGGSWECTGGCAKAGEDSQTAVLREVSEELGIHLRPEEGKLYKRYKRHYPEGAQAICDVWVFHHNLSLDELALQEEEVSDAKIISCEELLDMQKRGLFRKRYLYIEEMLKEICSLDSK